MTCLYGLDVLNDHAAHGVGCVERFGALIPPIWQDCNGSIESCTILISLLLGIGFYNVPCILLRDIRNL